MKAKVRATAHTEATKQNESENHSNGSEDTEESQAQIKMADSNKTLIDAKNNLKPSTKIQQTPTADSTGRLGRVLQKWWQHRISLKGEGG